MALLWEALATRDARLLRESLRDRVRIDPRCAWVNYVRSHDDIGWTFDDGDAARLGLDPVGHRGFLNAFYTGRFPGSFARGLSFQENPRTGDARVSGTTASLAGLEKALREEGEREVELAISRVLLLYGVVFAIGGIPLLYLGDELGTLNDYGYGRDLTKADDSRWVHRPAMDWERAEHRHDPSTIEGRVLAGLRRMIEVRRTTPTLAGHDTEIVDPGNDGVFAFVRRHAGRRLLVLANVTDRDQTVAANALRLHGLAYAFVDLVSGEAVTAAQDLTLAPYRVVWLTAD